MRNLFAFLTGLLVASAPAHGVTLTASDPVEVTANNEVVEELDITAGSGEIGIDVDGFTGVTIRNVRIEHAGGGVPGIQGWNADGLTIENVEIIHTGTDVPNNDEDENNIFIFSSDDVTIENARLVGGSAGIYVLQSLRAAVSNIEGHDFRGPNPRGQLVQFNQSDDCVLTNFSAINDGDPDVAQPEDVVSIFDSDDCMVQYGYLEGNNSTHGVNMNVEQSTGAVIKDVDTVAASNGSFGAHVSSGIDFIRTRARENVCTSQGRGAPASGGNVWAAFDTVSDIEIVDGEYYDLCTPGTVEIVFDETKIDVVDVTENDFWVRTPLVWFFPWESAPSESVDPVAEWITPQDDACLVKNSQVLLEVTAYDDSGLEYVRLFLDGDTGIVEWNEPRTSYQYLWTVPNQGGNNHILSVVAEDVAGNMDDWSIDGIEFASSCP